MILNVPSHPNHSRILTHTWHSPGWVSMIPLALPGNCKMHFPWLGWLSCGTRWEPPPAAPSRARRDPDFPEEAEGGNSCPEKSQQSHAELCTLGMLALSGCDDPSAGFPEEILVFGSAQWEGAWGLGEGPKKGTCGGPGQLMALEQPLVEGHEVFGCVL